MPSRFFSPTVLPRPPMPPSPQALELDASIVQHLQVLRLKVGDTIVLFDGRAGDGTDGRAGDGTDAEGELVVTITTLERRRATATIDAWFATSRESPLDITLAQALAVGDKMDLIVQKAAELGVSAIAPIRTARATLKLDAERAEKRLQHWQGVVTAACEQCGRNRLPALLPLAGFAEAITQANARGPIALLHPSGGESLGAWTTQHRSRPMTLFIGPEGGFADEECALAAQQGATLVTLGPRVLRTETAGLAALAVMQCVAGDFA